jgi:hypothetical protein
LIWTATACPIRTISLLYFEIAVQRRHASSGKLSRRNGQVATAIVPTQRLDNAKSEPSTSPHLFPGQWLLFWAQFDAVLDGSLHSVLHMTVCRLFLARAVECAEICCPLPIDPLFHLSTPKILQAQNCLSRLTRAGSSKDGCHVVSLRKPLQLQIWACFPPLCIAAILHLLFLL